ncbi:MAG: hypothetical protein J1E98_00455 [Lachnospiraceae bacterium]|nr:hypothetical protein [Lachnospiraceae bacterium]
MEIIETAIMPNGTVIQLEDWSSHNTPEYPDLYGLTIGAYPIAKITGKGRWVEGGEKFRLTISHNNYSGYTNADVKRDYEALKNEKKSLEDLSAHFWNGRKDMYYLGMIQAWELQ